MKVITLRRIAVIGFFVCTTSGLAQNEYSLGTGANVDPKDGLESSTPVDDFLSDEPKTLFDDEPKTNSFSAPTTPSKPAQPVSNVSPLLAPPPVNTSTVATPAAPQQSFVAPLTTDGSVAPIKRLEPGSSNDFSGVPPLPGSRRNLAPGQAPEWYDVGAGDTLFDVCSQLIDDGNYWPRLWSLNPDIKNPHFIYPGMKVAFYPGDPLNPPHVEVVEEEEMVPVDKGPLQESELIAPISEIPKSNMNLTAEDQVIEVIGPEGVSADESLSNFFETAGGNYTRDDLSLTLPAFIYEAEQGGLGLIDSGHSGEIIAGDGIGVRIVDAGNLSSGGLYSVLRYRGEILSPITEDVVGHRYDFSGNVRVGAKRADGIYDGIVQNSRTGLNPGDIVVPFVSTKRHLDGWNFVGPSGTADASVVSMSVHTQTFAGEGGVVFLDRGGLSPGSFYTVYQKSRFSGMPGQPLSPTESGSRGVGVVRVIESAKNVTVAIIVKNSSEIRLGDKLTARE